MASDLTAEQRKSQGQPRDGVVINGLEPNGAAAQAGLRQGDVLLQVNSQPITSASQFEQLLAKLDRKRTLCCWSSAVERLPTCRSGPSKASGSGVRLLLKAGAALAPHGHSGPPSAAHCVDRGAHCRGVSLPLNGHSLQQVLPLHVQPPASHYK